MESSNASSAETSAPVNTKKHAGVLTSEDVAIGSLKLSAKDTTEVIKKFQRNSSDVGSPEVQIALLTRRLEILTKHFGTNPKDHHSRKGMMDIISRRKRMLTYLRREDVARYRNTISALGLRK
jgi:small subunit ribosomal protein S15